MPATTSLKVICSRERAVPVYNLARVTRVGQETLSVRCTLTKRAVKAYSYQYNKHKELNILLVAANCYRGDFLSQ